MPERRDNLAEARRQWARHYSPEGARGLHSVSSLGRAAHLLRTAAEEALAPYGISFAQFELLQLLMWSRSGGLPMSKISARLHLPPASLTHTVGRLESQGLLKRVANPQDKRSTLLSITDQGIVLTASAGPALDAFFADIPVEPQVHDALIACTDTIRKSYGDKVQEL